MSDFSTKVNPVETLKTVDSIHIALMGSDVSEAVALLFALPDLAEVDDYREAASDYIFAFVKAEEQPSELSEILVESYRETYDDAYANFLDRAITPLR